MAFVTLEHFAAHLNESFFSPQDGNAQFVLLEVQPLRAATPEAQQRGPFCLLFRCTSPVLLEQKTFQLQHAELGEMGIFLVPVARDAQGYLYRADFT